MNSILPHCLINTGKKLFSFCYQHTNNTERARGIVQEIFCSLWDRRYEQEIRDVGSYLFSAARLKIAQFDYLAN